MQDRIAACRQPSRSKGRTRMHAATSPFVKDLVFVGGGHSHALALRRWAMDPLPGTRVTLINPGPTAPYSGMLPGFVAGHYAREDLDIDLVKLARRAGARLICGAVEGIDLAARRLHIAGHPKIAFDLAAIDVGITSTMPDLPGFADHAVAAKPLGRFADAWAAYLAGSGPAEVVIIGGGVAGAELAMAMAFALTEKGRQARVTLLDRSRILTAVRPRTAQKLRSAMTALGIAILEDARIARIEAGAVVLEDGTRITADFVTGAAGARPHPWLENSGLTLTNGFVDVDATLRSSDPMIFATGDCANMTASPRPKAGVYAVRQAPILHENLRRVLIGRDVLKPYHPQDDYLKLVSLGGKSALAERFGMTPKGPLMWRWKDRIDQAFMRQFRDLKPMPQPKLPEPRALGLDALQEAKPLCGGCGSKVGAGSLKRALQDLNPPQRGDLLRPEGDDAAILRMGTHRQVISTDHLRGFVEDPVAMTRIAAVHALGDIWAMGAAPQSALVQLVLPRMSPDLAERSLREITQTAQEVFAAEGVAILGGHSTFGAEFTIGFTVTGLCDAEPVTLAGARAGDALIMTKPIGTGVIMAAEMQLKAPGGVVLGAIASMSRAQARESRALVALGARAMTDLTGFGLFGHVSNICAASGCGAHIRRAAVPVLPGALELAGQGIRSSLFPENRALWQGGDRDPVTDLLFDPQTSGGLIAAIPGDAEEILARLKAQGIAAHHIGDITDRPGQVEIN